MAAGEDSSTDPRLDRSYFGSIGDLAPYVFDALSTSFAVIDKEGNIRYANEGWQNCRFGRKTQTDPKKLAHIKYRVRPENLGNILGPIRDNYLEIWRKAKVLGEATAREGLSRLRLVLHQVSEEEIFEFPYQVGENQGWMHMNVRALGDSRGSVKVAYRDVTTRRREFEEKETQKARAEKNYNNMIRSYMAMMDRALPSTAGHADRVADLSVAMAQRLSWDKERIKDLWLAAVLHDFGKTESEIRALVEAQKIFTPSEKAIVDKHTIVGLELVGFLKNDIISAVTLDHHENLNGTGYPNGKTADQLIPETRIVAFADRGDAMADDRPYREKHNFDYIVAELEKEMREGKLDSEIGAIGLEILHDPKERVGAKIRGN